MNMGVIKGSLSVLSASPFTEKAAPLLLADQGRTIMGLFADVTIEEKHKDEVQITEHLVKIGTSISDQAYRVGIA